jgi:hypothetical protein
VTFASGALTQFQVVMSAHSDAEGVPDFVGAVMKHVGEQVISKIAGQVPGVSYAKGMLDTVTKEYERAREARTSAQLRDFLVRFRQALTDAMNDLGRGFGDYKHMVETAYAKGGPDEKKQYQKALADHLSSLDRNWTNVTNVFSSSWPNAFINLTSDGRWVQQGSIAENAGAGSTVLDYIRKNGLEATTKVKGR